MNAHHRQWEPNRNIQPNGCGRSLETIINNINNNISLATPPGLPTHTKRNGATSTIDLTLCSPDFLSMINIVTLADAGSDHTPLLCIVQFKPDTIPRGKKPKWKIDEDNWEKWHQELRKYVLYPEEDTDKEVEQLTESIIKAADATFKKTSNRVKDKYNKYWWNSHCAKATALRRRAKMEKHPSLENVLSYRRLSAAATKVHKLAKRQAWRKYLEKITKDTTSTEIWRIIKAFKGKRQLRSPLKIEDELIFDIQRKAEKHAQHFQQNMYSNNIFDYTREDRTTIDNAANDRTVTDCNKNFTSFELSNAINTLESEKAVAADNIHNKFLIHLPIFKLQETLGVINRMWA